MNDVRASANLLHVGQVPFRNIQSYTHTHRTSRSLAYSQSQLSCEGHKCKKFPKTVLVYYNTANRRIHRSHFFLFSCKAVFKFVRVYCPDLQMIIRNLSSSRARFCCSGSRPSEAFWTHCSSWWRKTCRMLSGRSVNTGGTSSGLETHKEGGKVAYIPGLGGFNGKIGKVQMDTKCCLLSWRFTMEVTLQYKQGQLQGPYWGIQAFISRKNSMCAALLIWEREREQS